MNLKELFDRHYLKTEEGQIFATKFQDFYRAFEEIEVVEWDKEVEELYDKNPEVIDTIDFVEMLVRNGLMTREEGDRWIEQELRTHQYASKVMGVAYIEDKAVAFRSKVPTLPVLLHEAGHVYFEENDLFWNAVFGGGEYLMWLIMQDKIEGNEKTIRKYMDFLKLIETQPEKANTLLNGFAKKLLSCNALTLMLKAGTLPSEEIDLENPPDEMTKEQMHSFMVNMLEGLKWQDTWWKYIAREFYTLML